MGKTNKFYLGCMVFTAILAIGCKKTTPASGVYTAPSTPAPGTGTPGGTAPPVPTTYAPLAITVTLKYDSQEYEIPWSFVETTTTSCQATQATPGATCTVAIPEGRLYFSSIIINYNWLPSKCNLLHFIPYSYKASSSATYYPPFSADPPEPVDCSTAPIPNSCYGGPGAQIVPNFPSRVGIVIPPNEVNLDIPISGTSTVVSAWSLNYGSNRHASNDLPAGKVGSTFTPLQLGGRTVSAGVDIGDGYVANSYRNYQFFCKDGYYDPVTYSIDLNIIDQDSSAAGPNDFKSWRDAP